MLSSSPFVLKSCGWCNWFTSFFVWTFKALARHQCCVCWCSIDIFIRVSWARSNCHSVSCISIKMPFDLSLQMLHFLFLSIFGQVPRDRVGSPAWSSSEGTGEAVSSTVWLDDVWFTLRGMTDTMQFLQHSPPLLPWPSSEVHHAFDEAPQG
jgi:hypothetical protein